MTFCTQYVYLDVYTCVYIYMYICVYICAGYSDVTLLQGEHNDTLRRQEVPPSPRGAMDSTSDF